MDYSRKNANRGGEGEDMEFPGVSKTSKKEYVEFPGVNVKFLRVFVFGISNGSNTILWNIQWLSFVKK